MSDKTGIEWTDATWNPVTGCTEVTTGCENCYARTLNDTRMIANPTSIRFGKRFEVVLMHEDRLVKPLTWRKPQRIFVNSLSDLFHKDVTDQFIRYVFAIMALAPRHTFQILTKRPERMRRFLELETLDTIAASLSKPPPWYGWSYHKAFVALTGQPEAAAKMQRCTRPEWPLRNVWLGTSVEDARVLPRIEKLRGTPAAVRFLSIEPLIGALDGLDLAGIDWVIVGGESGKNARPMHPDWVYPIFRQCVERGIPFFFKQWGEWVREIPAPSGDLGGEMRGGNVVIVKARGENDGLFRKGDVFMRRVGKKNAGRELEGRTWDDFPVVRRELPERSPA